MLPALRKAGVDRECIGMIVEAESKLQVKLQTGIQQVGDAAVDAVERIRSFFENAEIGSERSGVPLPDPTAKRSVNHAKTRP